MNKSESQDWINAALVAFEQGQDLNTFILHCHPDNRKKAMRGYKTMQKQRGQYHSSKCTKPDGTCNCQEPVHTWSCGVPLTNSDVWQFAIAEGWKPRTGCGIYDAVAWLTKNGHKLYEVTKHSPA